MTEPFPLNRPAAGRFNMHVNGRVNGHLPRRLTRRGLLRQLAAAGGMAAMAPAIAAAGRFEADGPARPQPGALKGTLLDVALAGSRLVAVGERGHVLLSDDGGQQWRQAAAVPTRVTLTSVQATGPRTLWATGHGGTLLRSDDGGDRWTRVVGQSDSPDVLLALHLAADGRGLAVGGFGLALATTDGGRQWQPATLAEGEAGEKHFNRVLLTQAGTWLVAAEGGGVLRGQPGSRFTPVKTPYAGSLWSGTQTGSGRLVLGGMRGNLVQSTDDGQSWTHQPVAGAGSFTGAAALPDGRVALVGVDGTLVLGDAAGQGWKLTRLEDRATLTGVVPVAASGQAPKLVASTGAGMRVLPIPA